MTGDGRADYVAIDPDTGALWLFHNHCDEIPSSDPGGDNGDKGCGYSSQAASSWSESGAAGAVDNFIVTHGYKVNNQANDGQYYWMDDWLTQADDYFRHTKSSNLYCDDITTDEFCSAPSDTCESWSYEKECE